jgi:hypothetical protein
MRVRRPSVCQYIAMSASAASGLSSKFFPPPYRPNVDGPPISILEVAKQKLHHVAQCLPDPTQDQQDHLTLLTDSPGYAVFFLTSLDLYERLLNAKPVLIQGTFYFCKASRGFRFHSTLNLHVIRTGRRRPMEAPRRCNTPQQNLGTVCGAHILETYRSLANTSVSCQGSAFVFSILGIVNDILRS